MSGALFRPIGTTPGYVPDTWHAASLAPGHTHLPPARPVGCTVTWRNVARYAATARRASLAAPGAGCDSAIIKVVGSKRQCRGRADRAGRALGEAFQGASGPPAKGHLQCTS
jgi:hypothetical protein